MHVVLNSGGLSGGSCLGGFLQGKHPTLVIHSLIHFRNF